MKSKNPFVSIIMGSQSDWKTMKNATLVLKKLGVPFETKIVSAHRTPNRLVNYAKNTEKRGIKVILAAAGGAAHLAGVTAAHTTVPVLGIPMESKLSGLDSLLSTVQMPSGVPVATFAIGSSGSKNAALFAIRIIALENNLVADKLAQYIKKMEKAVPENPK